MHTPQHTRENGQFNTDPQDTVAPAVIGGVGGFAIRYVTISLPPGSVIVTGVGENVGMNYATGIVGGPLSCEGADCAPPQPPEQRFNYPVELPDGQQIYSAPQ